MNAATHGMEVDASAPVLYMALELSNKTWRLALSDGAKRRQVVVPAADLPRLSEAVAKAKERFGMPASARAVSCYEAGRDGFWLHWHLRGVGIENQVVDAASIEVSRRLRHVKTDRLDGERLLVKPIRHHTGERGGWSVVRVPSPEEEDARHLHRELDPLKRERLAHRLRIQSLPSPDWLVRPTTAVTASATRASSQGGQSPGAGHDRGDRLAVAALSAKERTQPVV